jgi:RimJ/RimL family protein N-acetyltransferase
MMEIKPVTLVGKIVRLEPLAFHHVPGLTHVGLDERIWEYMLYGEMRASQDIHNWVSDMINRQSHGADLPFAVIHLPSGEVCGATRYLEIEPKHRKLEIGGTWYGIAYQGTGVNTEVKYLLLRHAFEDLGCIRVQLKTDTRNLRSQAAIERLGAVKEGVLRNHMIRSDGVYRDSVIYSIIDTEWADIKRVLEERLRKT